MECGFSLTRQGWPSTVYNFGSGSSHSSISFEKWGRGLMRRLFSKNQQNED